MLQESFPKCFIKLRFAQMFTFYQQEVFAHLEKSQANEFFFLSSFFLPVLAFLSTWASAFELVVVTGATLCGLINQNCYYLWLCWPFKIQSEGLFFPPLS